MISLILTGTAAGAMDDPAYGAASEVTPKFISPSDPASQWTRALKSAAFFAYADNYLIDVKFGIAVDVKASRAMRYRSGVHKTHILYVIIRHT